MCMLFNLKGTPDARSALALFVMAQHVKERKAVVLQKRAHSKLIVFGRGLTMTSNKTGFYSSERASACIAYPDQVCIPGPLTSIQLLVMYSLLNLARKTLVPSNPSKGFARSELYLAIVDVYRALYKEEEET
ncbi:hypothetical protein BDY24DRAFT_418464 [Mrakia frigida]|uniref:uncharacterized protein n=1 Tax=Mrakia frigida TaxID=29902 RepID=UPI003FCC1B75